MADEQQYLSMTDIIDQFDQEMENWHPEQDANALLPPLPAGDYSVLVTYASEDPAKRFKTGVWGKDMQKVVFTNLNCEVVNMGDDYDGRKLQTNVSNYLMRGTNSMQGALQSMGYAEQLRGIARTPKALVQLLNEAIEGNGAYATVRVDWEAQERLTEEEMENLKQQNKKPWTRRGAKRYFPKDESGNPIPELEHNGQPCYVRSIITGWINPATEETAAGHEATAQTPVAAAPKPATAPAPAQTAPKPAAPVAAASRAAQQAATAPQVAPRPATAPPIPAGARRAAK